MNPILQAALGSILRHFLTMGAAMLITRGIWTTEDASTYVAAAAMAILGLGWALYQKWRAHQAILTALDLPQGSTVKMLDTELNRKS